MAWYKCGGGGALSETVLWTNPSPTANFASQEVTLSDDMTNYQYVALYWKYNKAGTKDIKMIIPVDDFIYTSVETAKNLPKIFMGSRGTNTFVRDMAYISNTTVTFSNAVRVNIAGNDSSYCLPTKICGLK